MCISSGVLVLPLNLFSTDCVSPCTFLQSTSSSADLSPKEFSVSTNSLFFAFWYHKFWLLDYLTKERNTSCQHQRAVFSKQPPSLLVFFSPSFSYLR